MNNCTKTQTKYITIKTTNEYVLEQIASQSKTDYQNLVLSFVSPSGNNLSIIRLPDTIHGLILENIVIKYKLFVPKSITHLSLKAYILYSFMINPIVLHKCITHFSFNLMRSTNYYLNLTNGLKYLSLYTSPIAIKLPKTLNKLNMTNTHGKISFPKSLKYISIHYMETNHTLELPKTLVYIKTNLYHSRRAIVVKIQMPKQTKYFLIKLNGEVINFVLDFNKHVTHMEYNSRCKKIIFPESLKFLKILPIDVYTDYELPNSLKFLEIGNTNTEDTEIKHKLKFDVGHFLPNSVEYFVADKKDLFQSNITINGTRVLKYIGGRLGIYGPFEKIYGELDNNGQQLLNMPNAETNINV